MHVCECLCLRIFLTANVKEEWLEKRTLGIGCSQFLHRIGCDPERIFVKKEAFPIAKKTFSITNTHILMTESIIFAICIYDHRFGDRKRSAIENIFDMKQGVRDRRQPGYTFPHWIAT